MSATSMRGLAIVALAIGLTLAGASAAADNKTANKLDQAKRLNDVAAQKMEADVRAALTAAQNSTDTEKAIAILKSIAGKLENDTALPQARRESLLRTVQNRIKAVEAGPDKKALGEKEVMATIRRLERGKDDDKAKAEQEKIQRDVNEILALQKDGKYGEARSRAADLAKQYPKSPAVAAVAQTTAAFDQLVSNRTIRTEKDRRFDQVIRDVERSAIPPSGDVEFPKDWREKTQRRKPFDYVRMSAREKAILKALNTPISVNFKGDRFQDVLEYLATMTGQPIFLDKNSIRDAQIDYETPINLNVRNVTMRTILKKILGEFGLTYVVKDEAIQVVSAEKAREMMTVRAYYMGDLLGVGGGPGDPLTNIFGPGVGQFQMVQTIASIIDMVQTIDPQSWQANGGPGSVFFNYATMSLVIKNSAEVHGMIGSSFMR